jgi:hypothetical protein
MNLVRPFTIAILALTLAAAAAAQDPQHQAHHPAGAASATPMTPQAKSRVGPNKAAMQKQMKAMADMHTRMMSARTPEERSALMAEHMQTMQDGMAMMQGMHGGDAKMDPAARQQMMEIRMDMMQSMMQMMMDRMPAGPPK